jgi:hypothetical protein
MGASNAWADLSDTHIQADTYPFFRYGWKRIQGVSREHPYPVRIGYTISDPLRIRETEEISISTGS